MTFPTRCDDISYLPRDCFEILPTPIDNSYQTRVRLSVTKYIDQSPLSPLSIRQSPASENVSGSGNGRESKISQNV